MFSFFCRSFMYPLCIPSLYSYTTYSLCIPYVSMCFLPSTHSLAVIYSCYTFIYYIVLLILYVACETNVSYQQTTTTYSTMYLSCIYYYYYLYTTYHLCMLPVTRRRHSCMCMYLYVCTTSYCLCVPVGYVLLSVLASFQCSRLRFASRSHYFFLYYSLLTLRIPFAYQIGKVLLLSCRLNVP